MLPFLLKGLKMKSQNFALLKFSKCWKKIGCTSTSIKSEANLAL